MSLDPYPTQEELDTIRAWSYDHPDGWHGLLAYVKELWMYNDTYWQQEGNIYRISTAGWSGNEDLNGALMDNLMFRAMCWASSRRGGHYEYEVPA